MQLEMEYCTINSANIEKRKVHEMFGLCILLWMQFAGGGVRWPKGWARGRERGRRGECQQLHPRCAPGVHCVLYAITPLLRPLFTPSCHSRHSCVVRLWVLTLILLLLVLLPLLLMLLLLLLPLHPLLLYLHPLLSAVQFIFCSICVFTLPFNAQKLHFAWLPPLALPSPPHPFHSVAPRQQSERREGSVEV